MRSREIKIPKGARIRLQVTRRQWMRIGAGDVAGFVLMVFISWLFGGVAALTSWSTYVWAVVLCIILAVLNVWHFEDMNPVVVVDNKKDSSSRADQADSLH